MTKVPSKVYVFSSSLKQSRATQTLTSPAMDLLFNAYSNASDDDDDQHEPDHGRIRIPPPKRPRPENPNFNSKPFFPGLRPNYTPNLQREAPVSGRYISKRERALLGSVPVALDPNPTSPATSSPVLGSISESDLPRDVLSSLRRHGKDRAEMNRMSERMSITLEGHTKAVNAIQWSPSHPHLLASAGMDNSVCIWNVWTRGQKKARMLNYHNAAVKDVKWSQLGLFVLSCGYDCSSRLVDVEKGIETKVFTEDQVVGVVKFHPDNSNLFLSGGSKGLLRLWDIRTGKVVHEYVRRLGPILDIEFTINGKQFISSTDISGTNVSENSIIVWDISRQVPLSNQVYVEAYTCPCVRSHPFDPYFVAQSNGNYIAIFSSSPPFKLDKYKRYENHGVSGFPIKCNFSVDGEKLASGSSDGCIYFYDCKSSELIRKIKAYEQACIDVAFHPTMPNVIASCCWNGDVTIFE